MNLKPDWLITDYMTTTQEATRQEEALPEWDKSDMKAHTLVLSDDEKKLLAEEGITLPTDMPLTKVSEVKPLLKDRG